MNIELPREERVVFGSDLNGHVCKGNRGDDKVMGRFGVKEWKFYDGLCFKYFVFICVKTHRQNAL